MRGIQLITVFCVDLTAWSHRAFALGVTSQRNGTLRAFSLHPVEGGEPGALELTDGCFAPCPPVGSALRSILR